MYKELRKDNFVGIYAAAQEVIYIGMELVLAHATLHLSKEQQIVESFAIILVLEINICIGMGLV